MSGWTINYRRVFPTWIRAVYIANSWAWQSGFKHRVRRVRPGAYRVMLHRGPTRIDPRAYRVENVPGTHRPDTL